MWKTIFAVSFILLLIGLSLLYQRSFLILSWITIEQSIPIPPVNCSEFGFGNNTSNNVLIYDFFIFNNELDMLEIHLYELYDYVDLFFIAESNLTLSGQPKPFHLKDNWARFSLYHTKIRRVEVPLWNLTNSNKTSWDNEDRMRDEGIRLALLNSTKDFFLLTSDADEIPKSRFIRALKSCQPPEPFLPMLLQCDFYYYSFEFVQPISPLWPGSDLSRIRPNTTLPSGLRHSRGGYRPIRSACFHCSYCFDSVALVQLKISSFSHTELNIDRFRNISHIVDRFKNGKDLYDRSPIPFKRSQMNQTELPRLLQKIDKKERFMYMLNRSTLVNAGFRDI